MTLDQVANALDVKEQTIMMSLKRNAEELKHGVHWGIITDRYNGDRAYEKRILYKRGIIRISMLVRSKVAIKFRDWVEDLVMDHIKNNSTEPVDGIQYLRSMLDQLEAQGKRHKELDFKVDIMDYENNNRMDTMADEIINLKKTIEDDPITAEQIFEYQDKVRIITELICERDNKKYESVVMGVWSNAKQIGRSYKFKETRQKHFLEVIVFLDEWIEKLKAPNPL